MKTDMPKSIFTTLRSDAMLGIAASLDITPLAEGIETQEQLLLLTSLGCKLGQGYLFSPPVPAEQFAELLKKQSQR